jgi:hypothetical protein
MRGWLLPSGPGKERSVRVRGVALAVAALWTGGLGCSSAGGAKDGTEGGSGGAAQGGSGGAVGASSGGRGGGSTGSGSGGAAGAAGGFTNVGVCGRRGMATADATSFDGYEQRYLIGEEGFGSDICVVRFDLKRVGAGPAGCDVCSWTQMLEYSNPTVATDMGGVCSQSDLRLDAAAIAAIVGSRVGIGFAKQLGGAHGSARMTYNPTAAAWEVTGNATWDEANKAFKFDYREGICKYGM